ncbi:alpha-L-fucosidase [uncultured Caulobacter sp.]|uniref:alpha-L-fucosidase n=1 Tax=uncultured Caulobacter sp. TaxID=158749 RepID=UPI002606B45E|nr:alpha-L-fucosidase [uncultured Caulobacter sp.]
MSGSTHQSGTVQRRDSVATRRIVAGLALALLCSVPVRAAPANAPAAAERVPTARDAAREARMAWWRKARFGMFIHWGVYAVPAGVYNGKAVPSIGEWIMLNGRIPVAEYKGFAARFNPTGYDPEAWASLAQEAGMKYVVITHKHHDGFALFDSAASDWNVVKASPYGKDLIGPLAKAVRARGLRFGAYYSQAQDWVNPGGAKNRGGDWDPAQTGDFDAYLDKVAVPQVREIIGKYHPDIIWWDTPRDMTPERVARFQPFLDQNPMMISNDRLGSGERGDMTTPEQYIPGTGLDYDFEVCMTMNDTWGFKAADEHWKSSRDLIRKLSDVASKGGNFLLNVGPDAEGRIPEPSIERLKAIGRWMKVNGEAIYDTRASLFRSLPWGRSTTRVNADGSTSVYLHVFDWPADGVLRVPGLKDTPRSARILGAGDKVVARPGGDGVVLTLPKAAPDADASVIRLDYRAKPRVERVLPRPDKAGVVGLPPSEADLTAPSKTVGEVRGEAESAFVQLSKPGAVVAYAFTLPAAGRYTVSARVAAAVEGQTLALKRGDATAGVEAKVAATGGLDRFVDVRLGELDLGAGENRLEIRPVGEGWTQMRLRGLTLTPRTAP